MTAVRIYLLPLALLIATSASVSFAKPPRVFLLNGAELERRHDLKSPDPEIKAWLAQVQRKAESALKTEISYVPSKAGTPPSGDKHDYMSQAPYFWRNPDTPTGLPYVRRDGERNPEIKNFPDHDEMDKMSSTLQDLALGYYFTGDARFAARVREILHGWFVEPATRMNPNLQFAQAVPGVNDGRGTGILESRSLTKVVDAIGLVAGSKAWTDKDQKDLEAWFTKYFEWITTSKNGKDEAKAKNNHGTFYDVQVASFALFLGRNDVAKKIVTDAEPRIDNQVEADGKQPLELARTKSWSYSTMNLDGLIQLARLGDDVGVDLWNYHSKKGGGIRSAIDFLYPYTTGKKWTFEQIEPQSNESLFHSMRKAATKYSDADYKKMMSTIPANAADGV